MAMAAENNWKWLLAVPVVNWLALLVAGQQAQKFEWVRWGIIYAVFSSAALGLSLITDSLLGWLIFWSIWTVVAAHSLRIEPEFLERINLLQNPQQRLTSEQQMLTARELGMSIDINRCSVDDLLRLPGVTLLEARRIVEIRRSGGPYFSADELQERTDVSWEKIRRLQSMLQFRYYEQKSALPVLIDVNSATATQIGQLEGIESDLAGRIVQERDLRGDFADIIDLRDRLNLPARIIARLMNRITF
jgi:DNA uptake protein ComE-like DNA-binding protein